MFYKVFLLSVISNLLYKKDVPAVLLIRAKYIIREKKSFWSGWLFVKSVNKFISKFPKNSFEKRKLKIADLKKINLRKKTLLEELKEYYFFKEFWWLKSRGGRKNIQNIVNGLSSTVEYEALLEAVPDVINVDIAATGDSQLYRWLMNNGSDLEYNDVQVQKYITTRIDYWVNIHKKDYRSREKRFDVSKALDTLLLLKNEFEKKGKRFFLSSGTLLGAIRENDFISSDYDIDVGVFVSELTVNECKDMFHNSPFEVSLTHSKIITLIDKSSGIDVDIFFYQEENGMLYHGSEIHRWWTRKFDIEEYKFLGEVFWIPKNANDVLSDLYGNWEQQVVFYDLSFDCPYRSYNYNLEGFLYVFDRGRRAFEKNWGFYSDKAAEALRDFFDLDYTKNLPKKIDTETIPYPLDYDGIQDKNVGAIFGIFDSLTFEEINRLRLISSQYDYIIVVVCGNCMQKNHIKSFTKLYYSERLIFLRKIKYVNSAIFVDNQESLFELKNKIPHIEIHDFNKILNK